MTREERAKDYAEHNIDKYTNDFANLYNAYLKGAMEETKELEKENAEAKELIKKFLLWENDWHDKTESKYELLKQAEQFLNSEVVKL